MYTSKITFGVFLVLGSLVARDCIPISGSLEAVRNGDIMIGGLFPVHQSFRIADNSSTPIQHVCERFSVSRLIQALIMIEAVEAINNSSMLNNLTFGYKILDTCSDVTTAIQHANVFMDRSAGCRNSMFQGVIGEYHSEVSIAVARLLTIGFMPQISYGSTAGVLSDKTRFPTFRRTVPEDDHQAQAITQILRHHNWTWIGIITTDGDYGRYAADRLEEHAKKHKIFVSYRVVLPDFLEDQTLESKLDETIKQIESSRKVKVIVSFAKPHHMSLLFEKLTPNASGRFWIAGESWATSTEVLRKRSQNAVGNILGVTLFSDNNTHFIRYLDNLDLNPDSHPNNSILQYFLRGELNKSRTPEEIRVSLKKGIHPHAVFSVGLAVKAFAHAVKDICSKKNCHGGSQIQPLELNQALRTTSFTMNNNAYQFSENGDLDTGYDILIWEETNRTTPETSNVTLRTVARYLINKNSVSFLGETYRRQVEKITRSVFSVCSESCLPGFHRVFFDGKPTCCFKCEPCARNTFTNQTDADTCEKCSEDSWSAENATFCHSPKAVFLSWKNYECIILLVFASFGILLTLIVMFVFMGKLTTPVVRAAGGPISILILLSLLGTFTSTILFGGKPTDIQCKIGQILFGLSFTLCVSCILVRYFRVLLAFKAESAVQRVLKKMFLPYWIIGICMVLQGIICGLWLWSKPPKVLPKSIELGSELLIQCDEGNLIYFGLMLAFIGFLAVVCFGFAFLGRKLPECYNEEKCISFSMLIYIISWVVFGLIYVNSAVIKHKPAVQMVVMLFSGYGILLCHFMPKCYIILFKKQKNTKEAFKKGIREFTKQLFRKGSKRNQRMAEQERTNSTFTIDSGLENIISRSIPNPYPTGTMSSFHLSIENLPQLSLSSGSSAGMNEENLNTNQTLGSSQKLITRIKKKRPALNRTSSVP